MTLRDEWGIRYLDTRSISMAGQEFITTVVQSEEIARTAATWTFGEWKSRDVQVVKRQVTEWEVMENDGERRGDGDPGD